MHTESKTSNGNGNIKKIYFAIAAGAVAGTFGFFTWFQTSFINVKADAKDLQEVKTRYEQSLRDIDIALKDINKDIRQIRESIVKIEQQIKSLEK